jgi:phosphoglycolate phosphatase
MQRPAAVLFDLDGTIIDSLVPFAASVNHTLQTYGLPPREPKDLVQFLGPPTHEMFSALFGADEQLVSAAVATYREHYALTGAATTRVYDGIPELLRRLRGQTALAVATSKVITSAVMLLETLGLAEEFDVIMGPHPSAINESKGETIARALNALVETIDIRGGGIASAVMVGDRRFDVIGARQHGLPTIGVLWGAGSQQELREAGAAALVHRPDEIPPLLAL